MPDIKKIKTPDNVVYDIVDGGISAWARAANKPTYTAADVGALPSNTTYVSSVNGSSGAITGIQTTSNLTTTISSSSTDTQYPSALAVYTALQTMGRDAVVFREWTV